MKKVILFAVASIMALSVSAQQIRYVDAAELNIIGKAIPTSKPFTRIDTSVYHFPTPKIERYATYSTGLAVLFTTDSKEIHARWETSPANAGANMTAITQKGLDLYIKVDGKWIFAGVGSPNMRKAPFDKHEYAIVKDMEPGVKECMLYLPIFDYVSSLEIGIEEGASITPLENPFRHKIIIKGSSVTHGASATRSGMTYVARFSRNTGFYCCNLGFSGSSKLEKEYAHYLADAEADAFIFDSFSNPSAKEIRERFNEFVDIIRAAHPEKPLIFMQTERRETRNFSTKIEAFESEKQKAAEEMVKERMKTDKHIYFIDSEGFLGDEHIATTDGCHPTDLGFTYMLDVISPKILKILKKYGIK